MSTLPGLYKQICTVKGTVNCDRQERKILPRTRLLLFFCCFAVAAKKKAVGIDFNLVCDVDIYQLSTDTHILLYVHSDSDML